MTGRFGPIPGASNVMAGDAHGTAIEVLPDGTVMAAHWVAQKAGA